MCSSALNCVRQAAPTSLCQQLPSRRLGSASSHCRQYEYGYPAGRAGLGISARLRSSRPLPSRRSAAAPDTAAADIEADVAIVGSGIIGLCAALTLLRADPELRVVLLDREEPCAGATGAGQGERRTAPGLPYCSTAVDHMHVWMCASTLQEGHPLPLLCRVSLAGAQGSWFAALGPRRSGAAAVARATVRGGAGADAGIARMAGGPPEGSLGPSGCWLRGCRRWARRPRRCWP